MDTPKDLLPQIVGGKGLKPTKPPTPLQRRLLEPMPDEVRDILYQHSILCQTCLPYRDPGDDTRLWQRVNGMVHMEVQAGSVMDPRVRHVVDVGLPWGSKARLMLYYLNTEALRRQSATIEVEESLTSFVRLTLKLDPKGRTINSVKEQLTRLAAADFRFGACYGGRAMTVKSAVIDRLELWAPKDEHQQAFWPTVVRFGPEYYKDLLIHAVPLNEDAVQRLTHSAMGLDVYTWLSQRLHRVNPAKADFVPWAALKGQFGQGYDRMDNFKRIFGHTLAQVIAVYRDARFSVDDKGMYLKNSLPPVPRRYVDIGEKPLVENPVD